MTDREHPHQTATRRMFLLGSAAALVAACSDGSDAAPTNPPGSAVGVDPARPGPRPPGPPTTGTATTGTTVTDTVASESVNGGDAEGTAPVDPPDDSSTTAPDQGVSWTSELTAADFDSIPTCIGVSRSGRGPFPTVGELDRRDISDGYPGRPFRFAARVLDAACAPIPGAAVEIWHTDASGDYSQYVDGGSGKDEGDGTNFCRGIQTAGDDGIVEFRSIYPGWYDSRTIHIHATVYVGGTETLTTQLYFDEAYTERIMAEGEYAQYGQPDTTWATDSVAGDPVAEGTAITLVDAEFDGRPATVGLINIGHG